MLGELTAPDWETCGGCTPMTCSNELSRPLNRFCVLPTGSCAAVLLVESVLVGSVVEVVLLESNRDSSEPPPFL
jgi:hypothetical protein